jgi:Fe-S-cluster-containing dehydrogenase component
MGISRRQFFGWIGAAAGAAVFSGGETEASSNKEFKGYPGSYGVLHDVTRCIGCRKCEEACNRVNELPMPETAFDDLSILNTKRRTRPDTYTVVNRFTINNDGGKPVFVKSQCNHCMEPACASACFVKALKKVKTGAVIYDSSLCVGCRYCMVACPFNIPTYEYGNPLTPRVMKCTMCHPRIEKGQLPGCVESCPKEALTFGYREKLLKTARQRIDKYPDRYIDHIYGEYEMGGTSWIYLSGRPFNDIGMRDDLGIQPAAHYTSGPLEAVPVIVGLWPVLLTGIYAISKRKEKISEEERLEAVSRSLAEAREDMKVKLAALKDDMTKEKEAAINMEVRRVLEEAAKKSASVQPKSAKYESTVTSGEEE